MGDGSIYRDDQVQSHDYASGVRKVFDLRAGIVKGKWKIGVDDLLRGWPILQ